MAHGKATSYENLQLVTEFQSVRKLLLTEQFIDHRRRPLAFWALPTDRRLPLAFLSRTLDDLLGTPFEELAATPGIGDKKIRSLLTLLSRVLKTKADDLPQTITFQKQTQIAAPDSQNNSNAPSFDPDNVSEMVWKQWQATIMEHRLESETFGRLADSLQDMTKVIWNSRLGDYTHITLSEMQSWKTHGTKRIRAILEVFHSIHEMVAGIQCRNRLIVRVVPQLIDQVENWVAHSMQHFGVPSEDEILQRFTLPLLQQIRIDASQQIYQLAEKRTGINSAITSVRQVARDMGLTRARVYQLLNEINDIMMVRWPNGRYQAYTLRDKFRKELDAQHSPMNIEQFLAAIELFYPSSRRGASETIEPTIAVQASPGQDLEEKRYYEGHREPRFAPPGYQHSEDAA